MATNPEGLKRWLEIHHNLRQQGAPVQLERTKITFEKLATIRVPTLLMPGDQDLQTPPWVISRQLVHVSGAQIIVLPEAAHSITWEQPEAFNRNVLEFIRGHSQQGREVCHSRRIGCILLAFKAVMSELVQFAAGKITAREERGGHL